MTCRRDTAVLLFSACGVLTLACQVLADPRVDVQPVKGDSSSNQRSSGTSADPDIDWGPFEATLQRRITRAWFPPNRTVSERVIVVFTVHKNGTISDLRIESGSKDPIADEAALKAVRTCAPFRY